MYIAPTSLRGWVTLAALSLIVASAHAGNPVPLVGTDPPARHRPPSVASSNGDIVPVDTALVSCSMLVTFSDVEGGDYPGTNYDGVLMSGGLFFSERFAGQSLSPSDTFDVVSGVPSGPLQPEAGQAGQNLDVFDYAGNALAGLGPIGYSDVDAIGEGSIAILFPAPQSKVRLSLLGGNGGSATLRFYRRNGSLIDEVVVSDLADLSYAFGTVDDSYIIGGVLIQNTDVSGIGIDDVCYDGAPVSTRSVSWGSLKRLFR